MKNMPLTTRGFLSQEHDNMHYKKLTHIRGVNTEITNNIFKGKKEYPGTIQQYLLLFRFTKGPHSDIHF